MRDERAIPLFCHMVASDDYRRRMPKAYLAAVEGLAALGGRESVAALRQALHQGDWWAPLRTRTLRRAVAAALARVGTPDAFDALKAASVTGSSGVRAIARDQLAAVPATPRGKGRQR
jgi:HEAT repeat protein